MDGLPTAAPASRPGAAAALLAAAFVLLVAAVFRGDGSGPDALLELALGLAALAVAVAVATRAGALQLARLSRESWVAVAATTGLAIWAGVSIIWSITGDRSWTALDRGLVYVGFLGLGLALGALGARTARGVAAVVGAVLLAAVLWALLGKVIPGLDPGGDRVARLRQPVEYWNALALLAGALIPFALWGVTRDFGRGAVRALAAIVVMASAITVALTVSRAGAAGAALAVALAVVLLRDRVEAGLICASGVIPAAALAAWSFTQPALVDDGATRADRVTAGGWLAVGLVLAAAAAAGLGVLSLRLLARRRDVGRGLLVLGLLAIAASAIGLATWGGSATAEECTNNPSRLGSLCANNRLEWWREAREIFVDNPLGGTGADTFAIARLAHRENGREVSQPHSVPLQIAASLGVVGLALLATLVVAAVAGLRRALRRLDGEERSAAVPLVALTAVYALHALVDYDLDFVAVTAPTLVALGATLAAGRPAFGGRPSRLSIAAVAVTGLAVVLSVASPRLAERQIRRTYVAIDAGDLHAAGERADSAARLNPLAPEPLWARALVAEQRGDLDRAHALYLDAVDLQPRNPATWYELGVFRLLALEDECLAYEALNRAHTLDQMNSTLWTPGGPLDVARDAVNNGACER